MILAKVYEDIKQKSKKKTFFASNSFTACYNNGNNLEKFYT